jgi:hypothetical protein
MDVSNEGIEMSEVDLKEIFSLFTSASEHERKQICDPSGTHYFLRVDLSDEYELTQEKREYALDAVRSVLYFLHRSGYRLEKDGGVADLRGIRRHFVG